VVCACVRASYTPSCVWCVASGQVLVTRPLLEAAAFARESAAADAAALLDDAGGADAGGGGGLGGGGGGTVVAVAGASLELDEFFSVTMRGAKDKLEFVLLADALLPPLLADAAAGAGEGGGARSGAGSGPVVVGFATLPHYDDRVMFGNEVGLRLRLVPGLAATLSPRAAKGCVLKLCASWADKGDVEGMAGGGGEPWPRSLLVNVVGFAASVDLTREGAPGGGGRREPNLHVQVSNRSTGQVNRTRTAKATSFPCFEEVFHVRVRSPRDSVALALLDRGAGHRTGDALLGTATLPLSANLLNNREAALEVAAFQCGPVGGKVVRRVVGVLQVAAMWESTHVT